MDTWGHGDQACRAAQGAVILACEAHGSEALTPVHWTPELQSWCMGIGGAMQGPEASPKFTVCMEPNSNTQGQCGVLRPKLRTKDKSDLLTEPRSFI